MNPDEFQFDQIGSAPEQPGIYSWYYRIELTDRDISDCINGVLATGEIEAKAKIVSEFLDKRLFGFYKEAPYNVEVKGRLKPTYAGRLHHQSPVSESLVARIVEQPHRLHELKRMLLDTVPRFASPIYIGVAKNLRNRLGQHKKLIEQFRNALSIDESCKLTALSTEDEEDLRDHSFAYEVCSLRRLNVTRLFVCTLAYPVDEGIRIDLENVLNRINFPLCGRN